jgi:hypothetical protein
MNASLGNEDASVYYVEQIDVPPFIPISVNMYKAWAAGDSGVFYAMMHDAQEAAVKISEKSIGGLVAVRSSAVYSEDGESHTGAGIYESVTVDPSDSEAFVNAIIDVYKSVASPNAQAYQNAVGVTAEQMGLVIQSYVEQTYENNPPNYGYVNTAGINPNLIEVHTTEGVLLFDKPKVMANLMVYYSYLDEKQLLHSTPDHSTTLRRMVYRVGPAINAAALAEKLFGKPVQIEYVDNQVVQVRPLPSAVYEQNGPITEFPQDIEALTESTAIGNGDMVLGELDMSDDNREKEGFVVFRSEYAFTQDYNINNLPGKGAVVIIEHSDSGHIQTLCQEKGLMCFYANKKAGELTGIKEASVAQKSNIRQLRFVANGYHGRIYELK